MSLWLTGPLLYTVAANRNPHKSCEKQFNLGFPSPYISTVLALNPAILSPLFRTCRLWSWCRWTLLSSGEAPLPLPSALTLLLCSTGVTLQAAAQSCGANINTYWELWSGFLRVDMFVFPGDAHLWYWLNFEKKQTIFWEIMQEGVLFLILNFHCNNVFLIYHRMFRTKWEKFLRCLSCQNKFLQWVYN